MPETIITEGTFRDIVEILLHGAVYDETNDSELLAALRLQPDKTLRTYSLQVGTDAAGRERIELIDSNRTSWVRNYDGYLQVDPVLMTNVEADLWVPGTTAAEHYAVEFNIINIDTASAYVTVAIGHAVGGGALTPTEFILRADTIPIRGQTGWQGPYIIAGDDAIRGNAAVVDDATVHWRIKQVDIGA